MEATHTKARISELQHALMTPFHTASDATQIEPISGMLLRRRAKRKGWRPLWYRASGQDSSVGNNNSGRSINKGSDAGQLTMVYYKTFGHKKPKGLLQVAFASRAVMDDLEVDTSQSTNRSRRYFMLFAPGRVDVLCARTEKDLDMWVEHMHNALLDNMGEEEFDRRSRIFERLMPLWRATELQQLNRASAINTALYAAGIGKTAQEAATGAAEFGRSEQSRKRDSIQLGKTVRSGRLQLLQEELKVSRRTPNSIALDDEEAMNRMISSVGSELDECSEDYELVWKTCTFKLYETGNVAYWHTSNTGSGVTGKAPVSVWHMKHTHVDTSVEFDESIPGAKDNKDCMFVLKSAITTMVLCAKHQIARDEWAMAFESAIQQSGTEKRSKGKSRKISAPTSPILSRSARSPVQKMPTYQSLHMLSRSPDGEPRNVLSVSTSALLPLPHKHNNNKHTMHNNTYAKPQPPSRMTTMGTMQLLDRSLQTSNTIRDMRATYEVDLDTIANSVDTVTTASVSGTITSQDNAVNAVKSSTGYRAMPANTPMQRTRERRAPSIPPDPGPGVLNISDDESVEHSARVYDANNNDNNNTTYNDGSDSMVLEDNNEHNEHTSQSTHHNGVPNVSSVYHTIPQHLVHEGAGQCKYSDSDETYNNSDSEDSDARHYPADVTSPYQLIHIHGDTPRHSDAEDADGAYAAIRASDMVSGRASRTNSIASNNANAPTTPPRYDDLRLTPPNSPLRGYQPIRFNIDANTSTMKNDSDSNTYAAIPYDARMRAKPNRFGKELRAELHWQSLIAPENKGVFNVPLGVTTIGRSQRNTFSVDNVYVSRQHARFDLSLTQCDLFDLGGTGTLLNDDVVQHAILHPGDVITLGPHCKGVRIQFHVEKRGSRFSLLVNKIRRRSSHQNDLLPQ